MIISANYANQGRTAVIVRDQTGVSRSLSLIDTPVEWAEFLTWAASNTVTPYAPADLNELDTAELNRALTEPGSVVRALAEVMFAEINKLRVKTGDAAYTKAQFVAALKAKMRNGA